VDSGLGELLYYFVGLAVLGGKAFRRVESWIELSLTVGFDERLDGRLGGDGSCTAESERRRKQGNEAHDESLGQEGFWLLCRRSSRAL
jgi:hypothetical protein